MNDDAPPIQVQTYKEAIIWSIEEAEQLLLFEGHMKKEMDITITMDSVASLLLNYFQL